MSERTHCCTFIDFFVHIWISYTMIIGTVLIMRAKPEEEGSYGLIPM